MQLNTITDFDFGVGSVIRLPERVGQAPNNVTKLDENFILWLLLEQEFRVSKRVVNQIGRGLSDPSIGRTHHDGLGERSIFFPRLNPDTERIARQYAEASLREAGVDSLLDDLPEDYRAKLLLQFYRSTELLRGDSIGTVPEIFQAIRSSSKFDKTFNISACLGEGRYGEVYNVRLKKDPSSGYAVKKISVTFESLKEDVQMAINESNILKRLKGHRNIVELHDFWLELEQSPEEEAPSSLITHYNEDGECVGRLKFYIQLELCGDSLQTWKEDNHERNLTLGSQQILNIAKDIFDGLAYIHYNDILHLDINPRNIVWANPDCTHLKIVDFGFAISGSSCNERRGTPGYAAPEAIFTSKSDIYSASVTIIEVARTIFTNSELEQIIRSKIPGVGVDILDELLSQALNDDPAHRPSADMIRAILPLPRREN